MIEFMLYQWIVPKADSARLIAKPDGMNGFPALQFCPHLNRHAAVGCVPLPGVVFGDPKLDSISCDCRESRGDPNSYLQQFVDLKRIVILLADS